MRQRTFVVGAIAIASLLGACQTGQSIGVKCTYKGQKDCVQTGASLPDSPKPKTTKTRTPTAKPAVVKTTQPPPPDNGCHYKPHTYVIVIRDVSNGYQPVNLRLYQTDIVKFTNLDSSNKHSWTSETAGMFDSGQLTVNQSYTLTVHLKPGLYYWKDTAVPYIVHRGPLSVVKLPC